MLTAGSRIDRFELVAVLGEGGQGSVWRAVDLVDGTSRALKLVPLSELGASTLERARREAHLLSKLTHPGLVRCFGLFESFEHGALGLVLELVEGETLERALNDPRLDRQRREMVITQLVEALAYLHERGLVHRDLKPANVMLTGQFWATPGVPGSVRLVDFGIAVAGHDPKRLTRTGHFIGTVPYLPPEAMDPREFSGSALSPAVDVFALGVLGSVLLQGGHPTGLRMDASAVEFLRAYRQGQLSPSSGDRLGATVRACCEPLAKSRPASASDVRRMLQSGPGGSTVEAGPLSRGVSTEPTPLPMVATEIPRAPTPGPQFSPYPPPLAAAHPTPQARPREAQKEGFPWVWLMVPAAVLALLVGVACLGVVALNYRPLRPVPPPTPTPPPAPPGTPLPTATVPQPPCCSQRIQGRCTRKPANDPSCRERLAGPYRLRLAGISGAPRTPLEASHPGATVTLKRGVASSGPIKLAGLPACGGSPDLRIDADDLQRGIGIVITDGSKELYRGTARHAFVRNNALCDGLIFGPEDLDPLPRAVLISQVSFFLDPITPAPP